MDEGLPGFETHGSYADKADFVRYAHQKSIGITSRRNEHERKLKADGHTRPVIILVIAAILLAGASITGVAAQAAIPGDAMYPVNASNKDTDRHLNGLLDIS